MISISKPPRGNLKSVRSRAVARAIANWLGPASSRTACLLLVVASTTVAADTDVGGHVKLRSLIQTFPESSLFRDFADRTAFDAAGDLRLNLKWRRDELTLEAHGELYGFYGDRIEFSRDFPQGLLALTPRFPDDRRRFFDLTTTLGDSGRAASVLRLDRLTLTHTTAKTVLRAGRQALSWGNGLLYAPMDLVNPFDPAQIDTEYKFGDDMLYGQFLRDNGDDLQGAVVLRRDPVSGDVESDQATLAVKYHGFLGEHEYDLLAARHYGDTVLAAGGVRSLGGAVWRGDVVLTRSGSRTTAQVVTSLNYSWVLFGKNMTGGLEYFYNGFGQSGEFDLSQDPELVDRLARGDLFTIGRHYLAGTLTIELTPLWTVSPVLLMNAGDPSALLQMVAQGSLTENVLFTGSVSVSVGPDGTEFGGIASGIPDRTLANGPGAFLQLAWYF